MCCYEFLIDESLSDLIVTSLVVKLIRAWFLDRPIGLATYVVYMSVMTMDNGGQQWIFPELR